MTGIVVRNHAKRARGRVLGTDRRRGLHSNITAHPASARVMQQLRDAFPGQPTHRHLNFDNDTIFSPEAARSISRLRIRPKRTNLRPDGTGNASSAALDHVVVLGEDHSRRLLREYVDYCNRERVHTSIGDASEGRAVEKRPSGCAKVIGLPRVGGRHHRYASAEAAG
jgi:hypothetical protein